MRIFLLLLMFICSNVFATEKDLSKYFKSENGCFILYDLNIQLMRQEYNSVRCTEQISPDSTFKIPLALMAFDKGIITTGTTFKWDGVTRDMPDWNQNQTPQTWMKNSTVWVSQRITSLLGMPKIKHYLKMFNYGNQDFSGNPGKDDGLTEAWLSSSLKISAQEQVNFLAEMLSNKLPVSREALNNTKDILYLGVKDGWRLYGKTGSGYSTEAYKKNPEIKPDEGWFVGFIEKNKEIKVFALNFTENTPSNSSESAGLRAKEKAIEILKSLRYW